MGGGERLSKGRERVGEEETRESEAESGRFRVRGAKKVANRIKWRPVRPAWLRVQPSE